MESWSFVPEEKGIVSNSESISPPDLLLRSKNPSPNWDLPRTPCLGDHIMVSGSQPPTDMGQGCFGVELGIQQMMAKQLPSESGSDVLNDRFGRGRYMTPIMASTDAFSEEEDSTSKFSSSVLESNGQDSPLIDLKLGRFNDIRDHHSSKFLQRGPFLSSPKSTAPAKRARAGGISSQTPYCQVYGCNKDLSSSKDYHKRHKVCEAHSKTSKVIVGGVEQRFCQQCSRFHFLAEFDDGKRSCRRRLAGHNERRRKPQVGAHSSGNGRLLQPLTGNRLHGDAIEATSFICLPSRTLMNPEKYGTHDIYGRIKLEDRTDYCDSLTAIPLPSGYANSKSLVLPCTNCGKRTQESGLSSSTSSGILGDQISLSQSRFQDSPYVGKDFSAFNSAATLQGFSGISESGCALSLLSSPSQNSSSYSLSQVSNKVMGEELNKLPTSLVMNSGDGNQTSPIIIPGCDDTVNYEISERIFKGPEVLHGKGNFYSDDGPNISLSQLSSHLQRVEHHRQSLQIKRENNPFSVLGSLEGFNKEGSKVSDRESWRDVV